MNFSISSNRKSMNSAPFLARLGHDALEDFKLTNLYKNHFSTEFIVWECEQSALTLEDYIFTYRVFNYNGVIRFFVYDGMAELYIFCSSIEEMVEIDWRYYSDSPAESLVLFNVDNKYNYYDNVEWLAQGNWPRNMEITSPEVDITSFTRPDFVSKVTLTYST